MSLAKQVYRLRIFCLFSLLLIFSCTDPDSLCSKKGVIADQLGVDGCTLVVLGDDGDFYVPDNILEFGIAFFDGQEVNFSYRLSSQNLPCFNGVPVTLMCIQPR